MAGWEGRWPVPQALGEGSGDPLIAIQQPQHLAPFKWWHVKDDPVEAEGDQLFHLRRVGARTEQGQVDIAHVAPVFLHGSCQPLNTV
jgi:hypothetical protein